MSLKKKKFEEKNVQHALAYVNSTFNNTTVSITDLSGNVLVSCSAGMRGFKGTRKSTPFAAQLVAEHAGRLALDRGVKTLEVMLRGPGMGRDAVLRSLRALGFYIGVLREITPLPHNGCRPRKRRRV